VSQQASPVSDVGLLCCTTIVLFSTGHWLGGIVAFVCLWFTALGESKKPDDDEEAADEEDPARPIG